MNQCLSILAISLAALGGCATEQDLAERQQALTGDLSITLHTPPGTTADGGSDDGTIVWEILEAAGTSADGGSDDGTVIWEIVEAAAATADGGSDDGTVIWEIVEANLRGSQTGALSDASGVVACTFKDDTLSNLTGPLLVVRGDEVYAAESKIPMYSFEADAVFQGSPAAGSLVLQASADQQSASPLRKALIAALLSGACQ